MKKKSSYENAWRIAPRLRLLRKKLGYTQNDMAGRIGVSAGGYKKYEIGQRLLSMTVQFRLVKEFNISLDWLLLGRGPMYGSDKQPNLELQKEVESLQGQISEMELREKRNRESYPKEMWDLMEAMNRDEVLYHEVLAHFKRYQRSTGAPVKREEHEDNP